MSTAVARNTALKQYFTDAVDVNSAMANLLGSVDGLNVLEPSVGNGALLAGLCGSPKHIDAVDVDPVVLAHTKQRFKKLNLKTHNTDFIDLFANAGLFASKGQLMPAYDAVISNPPYGLFFSTDYRKLLKAQYPTMYVRESYGLFLMFSLMKLVSGGRYVFLIPDTFLTSKNHASLRSYIFEHGCPSHIIRFQAKRFETVNFGYGNLCIIAGRKQTTEDKNILSWSEAFDDTLPLLEQPQQAQFQFTGELLRLNIATGWQSGMDTARPELQDWTTLGDVADCKTGIYTGDNAKFIGFDPSRVNKRLNGHAIDWDAVHLEGFLDDEQQDGLTGNKKYVPLIRGGHRSFNETTAWALRWDADAIKFYKTNKKARLQNAGYYFRTGLAVPMVTARRLSASLMSGSVFDQGVVGVFPHDVEAREAILLYLNSPLATEFRNEIVNGSANNSANYLKRLPIPRFDDDSKSQAKQIVASHYSANVLPIDICASFVNQFLTKPGTMSGQ